MTETTFRPAIVKQALMTPLFTLDDGSVWTANHPSRGRVVVTNFTGTWQECKHWCGMIEGTDEKFGLALNFLKRHTYDKAGVCYWEIPADQCLVQMGDKVTGMKDYFLIGKDGFIIRVTRSVALTYAKRVDAVNPNLLDPEEVEFLRGKYAETYATIPGPAFEDYVKAILIARYQNQLNP